MKGNPSDRTTLPAFLKKIEETYSRAQRIGVMDRGIPTEDHPNQMREPERRTCYWVGTPRGKIKQPEKKWLDLPWQKVREAVEVKLYQPEGEPYVLAKSAKRKAAEQRDGHYLLRSNLTGEDPAVLWKH